MEINDFIKLSSQEVRKNSNLLAIYVELYKQQFGYEPSCYGCSVNSEFNKLKRSLINGITKPTKELSVMEKTFQLRQVKGEILTYKKDGKTVRQYDNRMTEEFAIGFLSNGTEDQIAERKKIFKVLPKELETVKEEAETEVQTEANSEIYTETEVKQEPVKASKPKATSRKKKTDNE